MELFLDTADAQAVKELSETLTIAGVTTNPTIITRSGKTLERVIDEMCKTLAPSQKSFFQVIATDFDGILEETRRICALRENAYAKIPVTPVGLKAIKAAKAEGLNVLATAIYSADQAFLAAMNGADYLAPYVNRMCNYGDGVGQVADLVNMLATNGLPSKICAASFKNTEQVHDVICVGAQSVTVAPDIVWTMVKHPGTGIAVDEFNAAWENSFGRRTMFGE
ncbi:fructose-6-phosphate aldolase [Olsenella sp. AM05-17]|jgi:TalC/MipB family fructose-6-phosphate aldolase|uniref:transaldolase family protein n=1 Tax=unclassified Olsenella TaxID=2638792 RepID=UPI0005094602|nr:MULTISPECIES: transaldolase family protein [unclassified Olsenella]RHJ95723.1 fructose-6-phosphate aldolase [Olsenella sp. AM05-7]RHJ99271.1 fructose-6-phosphate aldolase [Olsenella sp. AM05-17]